MKRGRLTQAAKLCNTKPLHKEFSSIETPVNARRNPRKLCMMLQNAPQGSRACYLLTPSFYKGKSVERSAERLPRGPGHSALILESFRSHKEDDKDLWLPPLKLPVRSRSLPSSPSEPGCVDIFMPTWQVTVLPDRVVSAAGGYLDLAVGRNWTTMSIRKAHCSSFV